MGNCSSKKYKRPTTLDISAPKIKVTKADAKSNDEKLKYPVPSFDPEMDRFTLQHYLFRYVWQSNFSSPVEEKLRTVGARVLDIGCNTGAWVLDMAAEYENTTFTGIDVDAKFPINIKQPNVIFQQHNILERLPYENDTFEFVHIRFLGGSVTDKQWTQTVLPEACRVLKSEGYIELMEIDAKGMNEGPAAQRIMAGIQTYLRSKEINPILTPHLEEYLTSACLTNIKKEEECNPVGGWDESIGKIALSDWIYSFKSMERVLAPTMGINEREFADLMQEFNKEVDFFQTYWISTRVYGMKPAQETNGTTTNVVEAT